MTEAEVLALLKRKLLGDGRNGDAVAFLDHVRDGTGFQGRGGTIDAIAMGVWPSRGYTLSGYEVKCSRKDWLRELRAPDKAENFARWLDRMWLVVGDEKIVQPGELPEKWGLMVVKGGRLNGVTAAEPLWEDKPEIPRPFLAALLRSALYERPATPEEVSVAVEKQRTLLKAEVEREMRWDAGEAKRLREVVRVWEEASGVPLEYAGRRIPEIAEAFQIAHAGRINRDRYRQNLEILRSHAARLEKDAAAALEALGSSGVEEE